MVASKVTDISRALPGMHNPASKAVIGTRDGTQQVVEAIDDAKRIISDARLAHRTMSKKRCRPWFDTLTMRLTG